MQTQWGAQDLMRELRERDMQGSAATPPAALGTRGAASWTGPSLPVRLLQPAGRGGVGLGAVLACAQDAGRLQTSLALHTAFSLSPAASPAMTGVRSAPSLQPRSDANQPEFNAVHMPSAEQPGLRKRL